MRTYVYTKSRTQMFIAASFKKWKQPKCPPTIEWINEMWLKEAIEYPCNGILLNNIENKVPTHATT